MNPSTFKISEIAAAAISLASLVAGVSIAQVHQPIPCTVIPIDNSNKIVTDDCDDTVAESCAEFTRDMLMNDECDSNRNGIYRECNFCDDNIGGNPIKRKYEKFTGGICVGGECLGGVSAGEFEYIRQHICDDACFVEG